MNRNVKLRLKIKYQLQISDLFFVKQNLLKFFCFPDHDTENQKVTTVSLIEGI